jgi:hypothetical protein
VSTTTSDAVDGGVLAAVAVLFGASVVVYGLLIAGSSPLGGVWVAAVGVSLTLSGAVVTPSLADRLGVPVGARRRLAVGFAALALALFVAFVAVNFASFEAGAGARRSG